MLDLHLLLCVCETAFFLQYTFNAFACFSNLENFLRRSLKPVPGNYLFVCKTIPLTILDFRDSTCAEHVELCAQL